MFSKLASKNVKKSIKDYTIYFLTLTFGVCLFYVFNSIDSQQAMLTLSSTQSKILDLLQQMIGMVSVFISVILGFLIVYANQFLIRRRKKELGIYMILGMEKGKISRILIFETMIIGCFALVFGLFIGVFASQGLAVLTAKMFDVTMKEFRFVFSSSACFKSILYFGIIFIIVMIFNTISVSKYKLIELLTAAKKNEILKVKKLWFSVLLFLCSILSLGIAYYLIIDNGMTQINGQFIASITLGIIGTFLFFLSLSGFLLRLVQTNKSIYFKGLNMFVLRQINSKITTTFVSMTLICLMLFLSIGILSSGAGLAKTMSADLEKVTPYDLTITDKKDSDNNSINNEDSMIDELNQDGIKLDELIHDYKTLHVYDLKVSMDQLLKYYLLDNSTNMQVIENMKLAHVEFIPLSEYNDSLILQGKEPISLKENEIAISSNYGEVRENYEEFLENDDTLTVNGKEFTVFPKILKTSYYTTSFQQDVGTVIIPDKEVEDGTLTTCYYNIQFKGDVEKASTLFSDRMNSIYKDKKEPCYNYMLKTEMYEQSAGVSTVISYLAIYIGVIFLITCSAVLALQQLSESSDNIERYKLLRKIGVEEKEINKSIFQQIFLYFMMPLVLAIAHSIVGISVANNLIKMFGRMDASVGILASAISIILIYGGYMIATYFGCRSMLRGKIS